MVPFWWRIGNPTRDIKPVDKTNIPSEPDITDTTIIIARNEKTNRALWEVGYMLENMLLQAKSLEISCKSKVFTKDETTKLEREGISEAVAVLLL